ncbi:hypothetical protein KFE25_005480 [Diacronema lutheri]|uniref:T-cell immunomodulatory protein TIP C2 domain-containing protein n=1 Tax=Diacronema lutheri TaxID=2081491 RepID=A0A8J5XUZ8_DIALT|nr:hypothetical protein KFE25_005480 [Diacronema lutheri]
MRPWVLCALALTGGGARAFDVDEESYSSHELSDITASVRLDALNGTVAALGDFDSDQYTDLLVLSTNRDELTVLRWDHESKRFIRGPTATAGVRGTLNVVATDFNRDGRLDVLLVRERPRDAVGAPLPRDEPAPGTACTLLTFIPGQIDRFGKPVELPPAFGQPLALNVDADPATDLFGEACADDDRLLGRGVRSFWRNDGQGTFARAPAGMGSRPLAGVPSAAAVDIDGDCRADLVVPVLAAGAPPAGAHGGAPAAVELEVWLARGDGLGAAAVGSSSGYPADTLALPLGVQQLVWADVNGDGAIDGLAPLCDRDFGCGGVGNASAAAQDEPLRLVLVTTERQPAGKALCVPDPAFRLSVVEAPVIGMPKGARLSWAVPSVHSPLDTPPAVRVGDFDLDGFPDALVGLQDEDGKPHVALLRNQRGHGLEAAYWRTTQSGSYVITEREGGEAQMAIPGVGKGAHGGAFFDVDERGNLDILLLAGSRDAPEARLLRNAFSSDEFFLKVITLDGQCLRWCRGASEDPDPPPYGVNQPAVTYAFSSKSAVGGRRVYTGAQLAVSAHAPLLTPYTLFGLGRTNDYVTDFWVGLPSPHKRRFDAGIIPNSQLIVIPSPPDRPSRWTVELYISKAEMLPWVALALSAGLTLIGLGAIALEWRERREDVREKKAMAPSLPL